MIWLGDVAWWLGWPLWFVYFRVSNRRSRVIVIYDNQILLVKGWLGGNSWGLPGGGAKKQEIIKVSAARELREETGIIVDDEKLVPATDFIHNQKGISFRAYVFVYKPDQKPELSRQKKELADARWFDLDDIKKINLNKDTITALEHKSVKNLI